MLFPESLCMVRGGGDLASGVVYRLRQAGLPVIVLELDQPRVVRRFAAFAQAIFDGEVKVGGMVGRRVALAELDDWGTLTPTIIPVAADPHGESIRRLRPRVVVDARMAKAAQDTMIDSAPCVVGLGPGFEAGQHCLAVVETNRGHDLGRVIWAGMAQADTGRPEPVLGFEQQRVLRAPISGSLRARHEIGDLIQSGELIAEVDGRPITAAFSGVLRGLIHDGLPVTANEKVGDLDPRGRREACYTISDKSLAVGGGVVEAVLSWMQRSR